MRIDESDSGPVALKCGRVLGGMAGLGAGIWAAVKIVQPALHDVNGISQTGADWITAGISLLGGLEITTGLGATAGMLLACVTLLCCYGCCSSNHSGNDQPDVENQTLSRP